MNTPKSSFPTEPPAHRRNCNQSIVSSLNSTILYNRQAGSPTLSTASTTSALAGIDTTTRSPLPVGPLPIPRDQNGGTAGVATAGDSRANFSTEFSFNNGITKGFTARHFRYSSSSSSRGRGCDKLTSTGIQVCPFFLKTRAGPGRPEKESALGRCTAWELEEGQHIHLEPLLPLSDLVFGQVAIRGR